MKDTTLNFCTDDLSCTGSLFPLPRLRLTQVKSLYNAVLTQLEFAPAYAHLTRGKRKKERKKERSRETSLTPGYKTGSKLQNSFVNKTFFLLGACHAHRNLSHPVKLTRRSVTQHNYMAGTCQFGRTVCLTCWTFFIQESKPIPGCVCRVQFH